ncbi:uncharacterized protein LOC135836918 [Planococcus citri]|uniref:uncharacterized protein LOC135836918 n=1 Tax=Planococcus citri TaxID=170843 RepID=UPI0031F78B6E
MDPYYINVNLKLALFSIIIAFYFTARSVEAELPNENIMKAASCLREVLGEKIVEKSSKKIGDTLTDGEYLKVHCDEVFDGKFYALIKNKAPEDYDGTSIKKCLAKTNSEKLFQEYVDSAELDQNDDEEPKEGSETVQTKEYVDSVALNQNDDQKPKEGSETVQTKEYVDSVESNESESQEPKGRSETIQETLERNLKLSKTPLMKFYKGACKVDIKPINFNSLKDEKEKEMTVQCLAKCANKFLIRLQRKLIVARDQALKSTLNEVILKKEEIEKLKNILKPSKELTTEKFYAALKEANEPLSIDRISQIGKEYLISYNGLYYNLDRYIDDMVRFSTELVHIDHHLNSMRSLYQDCAKLECAMDTNSTPLIGLIKSATQNSYWTILKAFENDTEDVKNWMDLHIGDWWKFCQTLMID